MLDVGPGMTKRKIKGIIGTLLCRNFVTIHKSSIKAFEKQIWGGISSDENTLFTKIYRSISFSSLVLELVLLSVVAAVVLLLLLLFTSPLTLSSFLNCVLYSKA